MAATWRLQVQCRSRFPQKRGYLPEEGGILSTDGKIRPFDKQAQGTGGSVTEQVS